MKTADFDFSQPIPTDWLSGRQAIETGTVEVGDLIIYGGCPPVWADANVGLKIVGGRIAGQLECRVYRKMPCPSHADALPPEARALATKGTSIPSDAKARKALPIATGVLDYFPDALLAVAACSKAGQEQHNPGKPLFWDRTKSTDEADALLRHLISRGTVDTDGIRHSAKVAWRALALLQKEIEDGNTR